MTNDRRGEGYSELIIWMKGRREYGYIKREEGGIQKCGKERRNADKKFEKDCAVQCADPILNCFTVGLGDLGQLESELGFFILKSMQSNHTHILTYTSPIS